MFLTRDEVKEMTGKQKCAAQAKVLNSMGIAHKVRPDGTVLVLRSHVIEQLGGNPDANVTELRDQPLGAVLGEHFVERPMRKSERLRLQQMLERELSRKI